MINQSAGGLFPGEIPGILKTCDREPIARCPVDFCSASLSKRKMAAATLWCMVPGLLCGLKLSPIMWLLGLVFAFLHANIFEFFFHKAYHDPKFFRFQAHAQHHVTQFRENEAEKVALFSGSPLGIMGLLAFNIFPWLFSPIWPSVLVGFGIYLILTEEIRWRVHLGGGWIPEAFRRHHLGHHEFPPKNFNVWLPLGDWLDWLLGKSAG